MTFEERKSILIQSCFLETADLDYLTARWAYANGVFRTFYWSAAQCVEKYLKAALLYNGVSVKKYGHDLNRLYSAVGEIESKLLAANISMPDTTGMGREAWNGEPMTLFVDYLDRYGSPDSRYSLKGTFINGPVVHPLDSLSALLRCLIRRRNFLGDDLLHWSNSVVAFYEPMAVEREWMISSELVLERLFVGKYQVGQTKSLRDTFRSMNFAFFDEHCGEEATFGGQHFSAAPLLNHLFRLRELDDTYENICIIDELRVWAEANIKLPKEISAALRGSR
jgi:HEPN domain-containing protein